MVFSAVFCSCRRQCFACCRCCYSLQKKPKHVLILDGFRQGQASCGIVISGFSADPRICSASCVTGIAGKVSSAGQFGPWLSFRKRPQRSRAFAQRALRSPQLLQWLFAYLLLGSRHFFHLDTYTFLHLLPAADFQRRFSVRKKATGRTDGCDCWRRIFPTPIFIGLRKAVSSWIHKFLSKFQGRLFSCFPILILHSCRCFEL